MKKRVLVVDDDRPVREALSKVLRQEGYDVVLAADGQEALEEFKSGKVDLLLLDLGLPIRSDWDAFERITTENPLMPIIIISGQTSQYDIAAAAAQLLKRQKYG
jgi:two-component system response regulator VicR